MAGLGFAGALSGREYDSLAGLSLAGIIILAANPRALFDMGFQFSFSAALGIITAVRNRKNASRMRLFLVVCAGAQLGILPFMLLRGEGVPVTAVAANLLVVPLVGPLLLASWGVAVISSVSKTLAMVLAIFPRATAGYVISIASFCSKVPEAGMVGAGMGVVALFTYIAALVWIIRQERAEAPMFRPLVACAIAVLLLIIPCVRIPAFKGENRMTVLDIGEGDATLIQDGSGASVLIDGGPDGKKLLSKLQERRISKLDLVVLTHPHSDHASGLIEVLRQLPVGRIMESGLPVKSSVYSELSKVADERHVPRLIAREGQVVEVSRSIALEVLYSPCDLTDVPEDVNDCSIVLMARLANMRALLSGDISCDGQKTLLDLHPDLSCDVLKIPHQGAREAASGDLLSACAPALATISVGKDNKFGHPSRLCLELLSAMGIKTARTDRDGDIEISVEDGRIGLFTGGR
jgi:competence protein ComEC